MLLIPLIYVLMLTFVTVSSISSIRTSKRQQVSGARACGRVLSMAYGENSGGGSGGRSRRGSPGQSSRGGIRQARVARSIRDEISSIICDMDIRAKVYPDEDLLRGTSVSEVEVSPDLSYAKIYVSVLGNSVEKRQIFVWLSENIGQVRYSLAKRLRHMRRVPEITFKLANTNQAADLVSLIEDLSPSSSLEESEVYEDFEED